ncbi:GNAT family N-acetyltransferase [Ligilactobacillus salivarius]|uniref:Ribosomal-protein-serine acetyltransferase n=1 Tax=Ligilactobacillus salivarius SMXD51 TaxID=1108963 RepID=H7FYU0_9LACO|nr:GNAT family N-acetyltransferase [Ligilactobacillus salivarius]EIA32690.1 ribosomal-protein-serine acetyltransferase [Ligilactobacillus salivarius SMXD51]MBZ4032666.1 GNAT family N-acetyltransferase [Ligilactobacillus salivarius]MDF4188588.1 GNAT family N-acetyltransferase [Ligilactobacillus salivarius]MDM8273840.1 GNAT family N-acetyltransferase [Ligilactobacillus salivarius]
MDNVRIRLITEADSGELYQLIVDNRNNLEKWIEWIRDIHNEDEMHTYIQKIIHTERKEATITFVILLNEKVIGMADISDISPDGKMGEVGLWLSEEYQGKGIAGAVISEIEKYSKSKTKINTLKMLIKANNVNSLKMAHKLGYQEVEKLTSWKNGEVKWIVLCKKIIKKLKCQI